MPFASLAETITLNPAADSGLSAQAPTSNFGTAEDMVIGTQGPTAGTPRNRGLIRCDLTGQIPPGSEIKSVSLTLTVANVPQGAANSIFELRRVLKPWNENDVTWNNRGSSGTWTAPGAAAPSDFSSTVSATTLVSGFGIHTFGSTTNLIADVRAWVDAPETNFGWIVLTQSEGVSKTARRFTSRDAGANIPRSNLPSLIIEYIAGQTQAQPPRMSQMNLLGEQFSFQFDLEPQRPYAVEFNNAMGSTNWLTLTNIVAQPVATNITVSDSVTASQRFYRVKTP